MENPHSLGALLNRSKYLIAGIVLFLFFVGILLFSAASIEQPSQEESPAEPQVTTPLESLPTDVPTGPTRPPQVQLEQATAAVENLKEVQEFKQTITTAGNSRVMTEIESFPTPRESYYLIHVYELVPDGNGNAHSATFGWYRYYPQSGTVLKQ